MKKKDTTRISRRKAKLRSKNEVSQNPAIMGQNGLSVKRRFRIAVFAREYIIDFNGARAAREAGYKNPAVAASRLLTDPACIAEIEKLMKERADRCDIKADAVLQELAEIGFSDIGDYLSWGKTGVKMHDLEKLPKGASRCVAMVSEKTSETKFGETRRLSFKLHDKTKALEMIGRHIGMFVDKLRIEDATLDKDPKDMSTQELISNIRRLKLIQGGKK